MMRRPSNATRLIVARLMHEVDIANRHRAERARIGEVPPAAPA